MMTASTATMGSMIRLTSRPNPVKEGSKGLWWVLSIQGRAVTTRAGTKVKTVSRLKATPLARARPRSGPIWNCISTRAAKPMTVVRPLDRMEEADLVRASTMQSPGSAPGRAARTSAKRWIRKTE